jgi:hypothetical protein
MVPLLATAVLRRLAIIGMQKKGLPLILTGVLGWPVGFEMPHDWVSHLISGHWPWCTCSRGPIAGSS